MFRALSLAAMLFTSTQAFAFGPHCEKYEKNKHYLQAIATVADALEYTPEEFCSLNRILDVQVEPSRTVVNGEVVLLTRVTAHYNEYSCQYLLRKSDFSMFRKNCYNTW